MADESTGEIDKNHTLVTPAINPGTELIVGNQAVPTTKKDAVKLEPGSEAITPVEAMLRHIISVCTVPNPNETRYGSASYPEVDTDRVTGNELSAIRKAVGEVLIKCDALLAGSLPLGSSGVSLSKLLLYSDIAVSREGVLRQEMHYSMDGMSFGGVRRDLQAGYLRMRAKDLTTLVGKLKPRAEATILEVVNMFNGVGETSSELSKFLDGLADTLVRDQGLRRSEANGYCDRLELAEIVDWGFPLDKARKIAVNGVAKSLLAMTAPYRLNANDVDSLDLISLVTTAYQASPLTDLGVKPVDLAIGVWSLAATQAGRLADIIDYPSSVDDRVFLDGKTVE